VSLTQLVSAAERFSLSDTFGLVAYFTFGLTGALAAMKRGYDVIGILAIATITAAGGGLLRDGLLISRGPSPLLTDGRILIAVLLASIAALAFHRHVPRVAKAIAVIDALGLGVFTVHGIQVSLNAGLSIPGAILGGTITAVGGGLLRDILVREEPLLFKPGQFYTLVAIGGSILFLALLRWDAMAPNAAAIVTIAVMFAVRMLVIRFNWQTKPMYVESNALDRRRPPE
jgi:uncharacterized membrane protein YeiH